LHSAQLDKVFTAKKAEKLDTETIRKEYSKETGIQITIDQVKEVYKPTNGLINWA